MASIIRAKSRDINNRGLREIGCGLDNAVSEPRLTNEKKKKEKK